MGVRAPGPRVAAAYAMLILVISIAATLVFLYTLRVPKGARI